MLPIHHRLRDDDQICFIHIPKTAGNTLTALLENQFAAEECCTLPSWYELPRHEIDFARYKLLRGHVFYDFHRFLPRKPFFITMLREPVERTLSQFEMVRRQPEDPLYAEVKDMTFAQFVEKPAVWPLFANVQTRYLAYRFDIASLGELDGYRERLDEVDVEIAKERLGQMAFFGLTERFQESIDLLCHTFGWRPVTDIHSHNTAPPGRLQREDIPAETLRQVEALTRLDAELYAYAERLFETRYEQMMHAMLDDHYLRTHRGEIQNGPAEARIYRFDRPLAGSGWHQREVHPQHGFYRWTGPGTRSDLDLRLATDQDRLVRFKVISASAADVRDSLTLRVNERPVPLERWIDTEVGGEVFQGVIPGAVLASGHGYARLSFHVDRTVPANALDPSHPDSRRLGVAISSIEVLPHDRTTKATPDRQSHPVPDEPIRSSSLSPPVEVPDIRPDGSGETAGGGGGSPMPDSPSSEHDLDPASATLAHELTHMTTERVIEVPWALMQLPQSGVILDVGSCDATYLSIIQQSDRTLHCLDPRDCSATMPPGVVFHHQSIIGNDLPGRHFDAVLLLSTLEHIGLPCYGQAPFAGGDRLALAEAWRLLKPGGLAVVTVPVGLSKVTSWYRQYSPAALRRLFEDWRAEFSYWGYDGSHYVPIGEDQVDRHDYRDYPYVTGAGAGAIAGIVAYRS